MRTASFANGEYYHVYNRGADKREIFRDDKDRVRFLTGMREFNSMKPIGSIYELSYYRSKETKEAKLPIGSLASDELVNIICYCLNPNHFHFILEQLQDRGVEKFMHKLGTSYTKYFNQKDNRSGSLFQGPFKAVYVENDEYILWLSGYVNGNAEIHKAANAKKYKWCSYPDYLGKRDGTLCDKGTILSHFKNEEEYEKYVNMVILESRKRKNLEEYYIEAGD